MLFKFIPILEDLLKLIPKNSIFQNYNCTSMK